MEIKDAILSEHSKANTMHIVAQIGSNKKLFAELMQLFFSKEQLIAQRAAWVVNYCAEAHPELIMPYIAQMANNLQKTDLHNAVKRNTVRIFQFVTLPEELHGRIANICFSLVESNTEPIAVKAFSMEVLAHICKTQPDLANELCLIIEEQMRYNSSSGIQSKGRNILKRLKSMNAQLPSG